MATPAPAPACRRRRTRRLFRHRRFGRVYRVHRRVPMQNEPIYLMSPSRLWWRTHLPARGVTAARPARATRRPIRHRRRPTTRPLHHRPPQRTRPDRRR